MQAMAAEWLNLVFTKGVTRLGAGASWQQLSLSRVATDNLAGTAGVPPEPMFVSTLLSQLYEAGAVASSQRPFNLNNTAASLPLSRQGPARPIDSFTAIDDATRLRVLARSSELSPPGITETLREAAFQATAGHRQGASMRGKMLDRLRGLGGKLKDDTVKEFAESEYVVTSGKRAARAWVSLSHEALQTCSLTQGNARFIRRIIGL